MCEGTALYSWHHTNGLVKYMKKVLLINQNKTTHYRIGVYNYLSAYLHNADYLLTVVSEGTQEGTDQHVEYDQKCFSSNFLSLLKVIKDTNPDVIIYWINLKNLYLFPLLLWLKLSNRKFIYWGHGIDLLGKRFTRLKYLAYCIEHWISDAIILYGDHLRMNVKSRFQNKIFIANNTLNFDNYHLDPSTRGNILTQHKITTRKNIICIGRMQKRKRLDHLYNAFALLDRKDVGLIFVGPDQDGILQSINGENVFKIPPIYGNERLDLLFASDIFCLPGAIGLSIVDAFYCGLPIVTEDGDMSPEIMYLKDGINGFIVPQGDIKQLAAKLNILLTDDILREKFSQAAKKEIMTNGHIERMCAGFLNALHYVAK